MGLSSKCRVIEILYATVLYVRGNESSERMYEAWPWAATIYGGRGRICRCTGSSYDNYDVSRERTSNQRRLSCPTTGAQSGWWRRRTRVNPPLDTRGLLLCLGSMDVAVDWCAAKSNTVLYCVWRNFFSRRNEHLSTHRRTAAVHPRVDR